MSGARFPQMAAWEGAGDCKPGPQAGARAMMAYWLECHRPVGRSMGIYNCRSVRGSNSPSIHGEGRATDLGVPVNDRGHQAAWEFLNAIAPHAKGLGVQCVIFARTIWSAVRDPNGERYTGAHPHNDHIHLELNWNAARKLTLATLRSRVGDRRGDAPTPKPSMGGGDAGAAFIEWMGVIDGERGGRTRRRLAQGLLAAAGHPPPRTFDDLGDGKVRPDGVWGSASDEACRGFQGACSIGVDGVVGPQTLRELLGNTPESLVSTSHNSRGEHAGRVQMLLAARGFPPASSFNRRSDGSAEPDRVFGDSSRAAVEEFQRKRGITVDGIAGPQTWLSAAN